jgi:hypothetical protein
MPFFTLFCARYFAEPDVDQIALYLMPALFKWTSVRETVPKNTPRLSVQYLVSTKKF